MKDQVSMSYRQRMVNSLMSIGCWPGPGLPRPNMDWDTMRREIAKGVKLLDDCELLAVMWIVNALALSSHP